MNDNDPDALQCESCGLFFKAAAPHFNYSDGVFACTGCSPTYAEAQKCFERGAFDDPDAYREFRQRLSNHIGSGGSMTDKYFNAGC